MRYWFVMPDADRLASLETFVIEMAAVAAAVTLPLFRAEHGLEDKAAAGGAFDPVTRADRGAEAAIRQAIATRFPDNGVVGEEYGEDRPDAEFVWVLDPVDGTRAFVAGLPVWTTLIALRHQGRPVIGVIAQPFLGEVFVGSARGARLITSRTEQSIATRPCPALAQAVIATTDPDLFNEAELAGWRAVRGASRLARLGCDAYAYAMVALGRIDLVIEAGLKAWDIDAAIPLLQGAGGSVTDWRGAEVGQHGGQVLIAGDGACASAALERLAPSAA